VGVAEKRVRRRGSTALFFIAAVMFLSSGAIGLADGKTVAAVLGFLAGAAMLVGGCAQLVDRKRQMRPPTDG
jgi:predicted phage tail protein